MSHSSSSQFGCGCYSLSRRQMLRGVVGAAGAGLALTSMARAGSAKAIVLTCMDYRLVDDAVKYLHGRGLENQYDHVVLAGASAGALGKLGPEWAATFWKHVDTAIKLHHVSDLIVIDHRDCGAFKLVYGPDSISDRTRETNLHRGLLRELREQTNAKFPTLGTQILLMDLNGGVEDLSGMDRLDPYRPSPVAKAAEPHAGGAHEPATAAPHGH